MQERKGTATGSNPLTRRMSVSIDLMTWLREMLLHIGWQRFANTSRDVITLVKDMMTVAAELES